METAEVIANMLTENTGRHMLDSGGAYGRNWERNQGKTLDYFLLRPKAYWGYKGEYVILDVFHFLNDRLEYDADLDAAFLEWADEEMPDVPWMAVMEEFASRWTEEENPGMAWQTINTYNNEDSLSQVLQYTQINEESGEWLWGDLYLVQIHGGCDVRGGYTRPRVFRGKHPFDEVPLGENNDFYITCTGMKTVQSETLPGFRDNPDVIYHNWQFYAGDCVDESGASCDSPLVDAEWDEDNNAPFCPKCAEHNEISHLEPYTND